MSEMKIEIHLPRDVQEALVHEAISEHRPPALHAADLIRAALMRRGLVARPAPDTDEVPA